MNLIDNIKGLYLYLNKTQTFEPKVHFKNKKIAVVGAASSVLDKPMGKFIDSYDVVIRINKALITYDPTKSEFLGNKSDILIHNFHENLDDGGGGPIDWSVFHHFKLKYLLQAKTDFSGKRNVFNYYKKYLGESGTVHLIPSTIYSQIKSNFNGFTPTRGFVAIALALDSDAAEVYLTGFTFFRTPYTDGYRDNIKSVEAAKKHMDRQGFHDVDLEFKNFKISVTQSKVKRILVDDALYQILLAENDLLLNDIMDSKVRRMSFE